MRQNRLMILIAAILTIGMVSYAVAQQMTGDKDKEKSESKMKAHPESMMMSEKQASEMGTMMGNMSDHCQTMGKDFEDLESHFNKMMKIDDMAMLQTEMQKHQTMMTKMHDDMMKQKKMCKNMNEMMSSTGMMHGMHGEKPEESETGGGGY